MLAALLHLPSTPLFPFVNGLTAHNSQRLRQWWRGNVSTVLPLLSSIPTPTPTPTPTALFYTAVVAFTFTFLAALSIQTRAMLHALKHSMRRDFRITERQILAQQPHS